MDHNAPDPTDIPCRSQEAPKGGAQDCHKEPYSSTLVRDTCFQLLLQGKLQVLNHLRSVQSEATVAIAELLSI